MLSPRITQVARRLVPALVALVLLLGLVAADPLGRRGGIEVTAVFDDTAGLFVGNDVGILGVPVGRVASITPRGEVVEVVLRLDDDAAVPASAGAVVVSRSVATDRYVELTPADAPGARLADGDTIPLDRTRTPVEFDEVLGSLATFSTGLLGERGDAGALRRLLAVSADVFDGRGATTRATIRDLATAAGGLAAHSDDLSGTLSGLDDLTTLIAADRGVVDEFIRSVTDAMDLFADERHAFGRSLTTLSRALRTLAVFIRANRDRLTTDLTGLTTVVERLLRREGELAETVEVLPQTLRNIGDAIDDGRLQVKIPVTDFSPVPELTEPLCEALPADVCTHLGTDPDLGELLAAIVEAAGGGW